MYQKSFYFSLLFSLVINSAALAVEGPVAEKGVLDLRKTDLSSDSVKLKGEWVFFWNKIIPAKNFESNPLSKKNKVYITAPARWSEKVLSERKKNTRKITPRGYATYHLKVLLPENAVDRSLSFRISNMSNAYRFYVEDFLISQNGIVGESESTSKPEYRRLIQSFTPKKSEINITMHISNFHDPNSGGLWKPIWIGSDKAIISGLKKALAFDLFLLGALTIMSFYHFGLFLLRKEDRSSLAFGIFTMIISVRILFTGELLAMDLFPGMSWETRGKWEFLSFYLAMPVFHYFLHSLFPKEFPIKILYGVAFVVALFIVDLLIHPMNSFAPRLYWFQMIALTMIVYTLISMVVAIYRKREGSIVFLIGLLFFFGTVVFDIAASRIGAYDFISPFGLFVFIFSQSFILSLLFSRAYHSVQILSNKLTHTNQSYQRFVPEKLLSLLNKEDITKIELGEQTQADMPVLFSDIRSFTELSETMNPEENFNFLNSYLRRMGPIIRSNSGFIDKYLGDGIMALFPGGNENALTAAIEMLKELKEYNMQRENMGYRSIRIGIGLHRGSLMLGTIGESERMDATVISDSVNTASRIENLTKTFGCSILISGEFFELIEEKDNYDYRILGKVKVRGKKKITDLIEIFSEDEENLKEAKKTYLSDFNSGVRAFLEKEYEKAFNHFLTIVQNVPDDNAANYYYKKCTEMLAQKKVS